MGNASGNALGATEIFARCADDSHAPMASYAVTGEIRAPYRAAPTRATPWPANRARRIGREKSAG
jgi:hypothetical protein